MPDVYLVITETGSYSDYSMTIDSVALDSGSAILNLLKRLTKHRIVDGQIVEWIFKCEDYCSHENACCGQKFDYPSETYISVRSTEDDSETEYHIIYDQLVDLSRLPREYRGRRTLWSSSAPGESEFTNYIAQNPDVVLSDSIYQEWLTALTQAREE